MKNKTNNRHLALGTWIASGSRIVTEMVSRLGFDWLLFDLEHNYMQEADVLANLQVIKNPDVKVIVRMSEFRPGLIARVLDWGAAGIMMPHVSNTEEAKRVVKAMYFPPYGKRGFSSSARCFDFGMKKTKIDENWNKPLFLAQIENFEGVMQAEQIAAVEGVDMLFVGPRDLKHDLDSRANNSEDLITYEQAVEKTAIAAKLHNKQVGILVNTELDISELQNMGYSAFAVGSDLSVMQKGYQEVLQKYQQKNSDNIT